MNYPDGISESASSASTGRWELSEHQLMHFSAAAYNNARSLLRDSQLLFASRRYSRAASLAVIGCEEAGKALILCLAGMGAVEQGKVPQLLKALRYGPASHSTKQALGAVAHLIGDVVRRVLPILKQQTKTSLKAHGPPTTRDEFVSLVASLFTPGVLARVRKQAVNWPDFERQIDAVQNGEWQRIRDAGLYVDFERSVFREPRAIGRRLGRAQIATLAAVLAMLRQLMPITRLSKEGLEFITAPVHRPALEEQAWRALVADPTVKNRRSRSKAALRRER